ncbi:MAG TPA: acetyl-CoA carboxylase biotin carboxyl carrier protein subunit [Acidobacteriota bacterium]
MRYRVQAPDGSEQRVELRSADGDRYRLRVDGRELEVELAGGLDGLCKVRCNGELIEAFVARSRERHERIEVSCRNYLFSFEVHDGRSGGAAAARRHHGGALLAQMPGRVVKLLCEVGAAVSPGQGLLVVEAMKMENELRAPAGGTVRRIGVQAGQSVETGQLLLEIE